MKEETIAIDGGRQLAGEIEVSGAKNAALPCLFASLLSSKKVVLDNLPLVTDTMTSIEVLKSLGLAVRRQGKKATIDAAKAKSASCEVPLEQARAMRASILALGPLLAKRGEAVVPLPGGCDFGSRPIDIHLRGLRKMGAEIEMKGGVLHARADGLRGQRLTLEFPSFTGTENLMMAACLAQGETIIDNAAREPEIANLAALLVAMGAQIEGAGTSRIAIAGVASLGGASHAVMPDRIEAGTYLAAAAAAQGDLTLRGCGGDELAMVLDKLEDAGAEIESSQDRIGIIMDRRPRAVDIATAPYPGFPTDLQAQFLAVSSIAEGTARIVEGIWEQRFRTADELRLMGADIAVSGSSATVNGVAQLTGAHVQATDLRASAALVIAGLCASGTTVIHNAHHLQRGYEGLAAKLNALGARVRQAGA
ncbi:MAG: UDP-N-acetylglucosamine 1-carboxyvinyltransferase [Betaproteobacteria bacterium AqS2]|uniref:UDP-N-acetylglucosamine 1-carboxyvinyltransferase n=1 Tax=Candidatus Amphirhobacter heronislandensis TaxID=1732024 RepID=A0A930XWI4_9GAMM|nr:UDP-N-acetylglucosamine 1-carboxyvinyltransferase [Betaproteobacteria bacterium AqS2]